VKINEQNTPKNIFYTDTKHSALQEKLDSSNPSEQSISKASKIMKRFTESQDSNLSEEEFDTIITSNALSELKEKQTFSQLNSEEKYFPLFFYAIYRSKEDYLQSFKSAALTQLKEIYRPKKEWSDGMEGSILKTLIKSLEARNTSPVLLPFLLEDIIPGNEAEKALLSKKLISCLVEAIKNEQITVLCEFLNSKIIFEHLFELDLIDLVLKEIRKSIQEKLMGRKVGFILKLFEESNLIQTYHSKLTDQRESLLNDILYLYPKDHYGEGISLAEDLIKKGIHNEVVCFIGKKSNQEEAKNLYTATFFFGLHARNKLDLIPKGVSLCVLLNQEPLSVELVSHYLLNYVLYEETFSLFHFDATFHELGRRLDSYSKNEKTFSDYLKEHLLDLLSFLKISKTHLLKKSGEGSSFSNLDDLHYKIDVIFRLMESLVPDFFIILSENTKNVYRSTWINFFLKPYFDCSSIGELVTKDFYIRMALAVMKESLIAEKGLTLDLNSELAQIAKKILEDYLKDEKSVRKNWSFFYNELLLKQKVLSASDLAHVIILSAQSKSRTLEEFKQILMLKNLMPPLTDYFEKTIYFTQIICGKNLYSSNDLLTISRIFPKLNFNGTSGNKDLKQLSFLLDFTELCENLKSREITIKKIQEAESKYKIRLKDKEFTLIDLKKLAALHGREDILDILENRFGLKEDDQTTLKEKNCPAQEWESIEISDQNSKKKKKKGSKKGKKSSKTPLDSNMSQAQNNLQPFKTQSSPIEESQSSSIQESQSSPIQESQSSPIQETQSPSIEVSVENRAEHFIPDNVDIKEIVVEENIPQSEFKESLLQQEKLSSSSQLDTIVTIPENASAPFKLDESLSKDSMLEKESDLTPKKKNLEALNLKAKIGKIESGITDDLVFKKPKETLCRVETDLKALKIDKDQKKRETSYSNPAKFSQEIKSDKGLKNLKDLDKNSSSTTVSSQKVEKKSFSPRPEKSQLDNLFPRETKEKKIRNKVSFSNSSVLYCSDTLNANKQGSSSLTGKASSESLPLSLPSIEEKILPYRPKENSKRKDSVKRETVSRETSSYRESVKKTEITEKVTKLKKENNFIDNGTSFSKKDQKQASPSLSSIEIDQSMTSLDISFSNHKLDDERSENMPIQGGNKHEKNSNSIELDSKSDFSKGEMHTITKIVEEKEAASYTNPGEISNPLILDSMVEVDEKDPNQIRKTTNDNSFIEYSNSEKSDNQLSFLSENFSPKNFLIPPLYPALNLFPLLDFPTSYQDGIFFFSSSWNQSFAIRLAQYIGSQHTNFVSRFEEHNTQPFPSWLSILCDNLGLKAENDERGDLTLLIPQSLIKQYKKGKYRLELILGLFSLYSFNQRPLKSHLALLSQDLNGKIDQNSLGNLDSSLHLIDLCSWAMKELQWQLIDGSGRYQSLERLRGLTFLTVLVFHISYGNNPYYSDSIYFLQENSIFFCDLLNSLENHHSRSINEYGEGNEETDELLQYGLIRVAQSFYGNTLYSLSKSYEAKVHAALYAL
jgi:hypothetical protein